MVARKTGKLRILRPYIFFVEALIFRAPSQSLHRRTQLHRLARAPLAHFHPGGVLHRLARLRFARRFPVPRHHGRKRIQLEIKIGMPRRDHFVIHKLILRSQMAFQAFPPCGESRLACRTFPGLRIFHAPTLASCAVPASPTPRRGNSRRTRLPKFQMPVRAAQQGDSARGMPRTLTILPPSHPISGSWPCVRRYLRSAPDMPGYVCPGLSKSNTHSAESGCRQWASRCHGNSSPRMNLARCIC